MFTVKISTGGDAFYAPSWEDGSLVPDPCRMELRRLLEEVRKKLLYGRTEGCLMDINGNKVGEWSLD